MNLILTILFVTLGTESSKTYQNVEDHTHKNNGDMKGCYNTEQLTIHNTNAIGHIKQTYHGTLDVSMNNKVTQISNMNRMECKTTTAGFDYTGTVSQTIEGHQCQAWKDQHPHKHEEGRFDHEFPDNDVSAAQNFCRNPYKDSNGPYCYTTDVNMEWQFCYIPMCDDIYNNIINSTDVITFERRECKMTRIGLDYTSPDLTIPD